MSIITPSELNDITYALKELGSRRLEQGLDQRNPAFTSQGHALHALGERLASSSCITVVNAPSSGRLPCDRPNYSNPPVSDLTQARFNDAFEEDDHREDLECICRVARQRFDVVCTMSQAKLVWEAYSSTHSCTWLTIKNDDEVALALRTFVSIGS